MYGSQAHPSILMHDFNPQNTITRLHHKKHEILLDNKLVSDWNLSRPPPPPYLLQLPREKIKRQTILVPSSLNKKVNKHKELEKESPVFQLSFHVPRSFQHFLWWNH